MALEVVMQALLTCSLEALKTAGREPGRVGLLPGPEAIWDECCDGWLYVRVNPITPGLQQGNCGPSTLTDSLFVGVLRCAHTVSDNRLPTAAEVNSDALAMIQDMETLLEAIICCFLPGRPQAKLGVWSPLYQGDCHGGEWQVDVVSTVCGCDE